MKLNKMIWLEERGREIMQHVEVVRRIVGRVGYWYWLHLVPVLMR